MDITDMPLRDALVVSLGPLLAVQEHCAVFVLVDEGTAVSDDIAEGAATLKTEHAALFRRVIHVVVIELFLILPLLPLGNPVVNILSLALGSSPILLDLRDSFHFLIIMYVSLLK